MYVYQVADDYDFLYWSSPLDELTKIESISDRRAFEWSLSASEQERARMPEMANVIPAQFFSALSLQVAQSVHLLISGHGFDFERMSGLWVQRVNELEAGPDVLFIIGISTKDKKYVVTPIEMTGRFHSTMSAVLLSDSTAEVSTGELVH